MYNKTEQHQPIEDIVEPRRQSHLSQVHFCKQEGLASPIIISVLVAKAPQTAE